MPNPPSLNSRKATDKVWEIVDRFPNHNKVKDERLAWVIAGFRCQWRLNDKWTRDVLISAQPFRAPGGTKGLKTLVYGHLMNFDKQVR